MVALAQRPPKRSISMKLSLFKGRRTSRAFMIPAQSYDVTRLVGEWNWLIPVGYTPLFISVLADWVFGAPDGSLWCLSVLEGNFTKIATNSNEYNRLNKSQEWLNKNFIADWQAIAAGRGLLPNDNQCLGWKVHPLLGGGFEVENLQVFEMAVYQSIMGQLHRQLQERVNIKADLPRH